MVTRGNILSEKVGKKVSDIHKRFLDEVYNQVMVMVKSPAVVDILHNMVLGKVSMIGGKYFSGVDDPTDPSDNQWSGEFRREIEKNLSQAVVTMAGKSISVSFTLLSDEFLGVDTGGPTNSNDTKPMRWLYFFIYGNLENNLYWVPKSIASEVPPLNYTGRFREGYLVQKSSGDGDGGLSPGLIKKFKLEKHPQCGKAGNPDLFQSILTNDLIKDIIVDPAIEAASAIVFSE